MSPKSKTPKGAFVYVPEGAKTNDETNKLPPPPVEYENRKVAFNKNAVKKVVKGQYGNDNS